jgi:hypothetical protein
MMQIEAIILYSIWGDIRIVKFKPGRLNIVTGESKTGKSALLDIIEFCLGRDSVQMPIGPITQTVSWYAALFSVGESKAFVARPAPKPGKASTNQAMIAVDSRSEIPALRELNVNCDSRTLRDILDTLIGIEENQHTPPPNSARYPVEAHIGHAGLLCLQKQGEIAGQDRLFHRQSDQGMAQTLKDTIPYFLGASVDDQALKRSYLASARRSLRSLEGQYQQAELAAQTARATLDSLWREAQALGIVDSDPPEDPEDLVSALRRSIVVEGAESDQGSPQSEELVALTHERDELIARLRALTDDRETLLRQSKDETSYVDALRSQHARLTSLELLGAAANFANDTTDMPPPLNASCPICGSTNDDSNTTVQDLQQGIHEIRKSLRGVDIIRPARRAALDELDESIETARNQLRVATQTIRAISSGRSANELLPDTSQRDFTRGRIHAILSTLGATSDEELSDLRAAQVFARSRVAQLQSELDPTAEDSEVQARLLSVSQDMTAWAERLGLEHVGERVRIDLSHLTVVSDTDLGSIPLFRIGSAENWIGYHIVAHLGLHKYFTTHDRPVPRFLFLDQPTQAWFQSEVDQQVGNPAQDSDRAAVDRIFRLIYDFVQELAPRMQVIICDHANLPENWFQDSVEHNWREGEKLIPESWIRRLDQ